MEEDKIFEETLISVPVKEDVFDSITCKHDCTKCYKEDCEERNSAPLLDKEFLLDRLEKVIDRVNNFLKTDCGLEIKELFDKYNGVKELQEEYLEKTYAVFKKYESEDVFSIAPFIFLAMSDFSKILDLK